jgi:hypothetical protein
MNFSNYKNIFVTNWELSQPNIITCHMQHHKTKHKQNTTPPTTNRQHKKKQTNGKNYVIIVTYKQSTKSRRFVKK